MLITNQWSQSKPVENGKNIRINFSKGNFQIQVHSANGQMIGRFVPDDRKEFIISADEFQDIWHPQISFKAPSGELHVHFEQ